MQNSHHYYNTFQAGFVKLMLFVSIMGPIQYLLLRWIFYNFHDWDFADSTNGGQGDLQAKGCLDFGYSVQTRLGLHVSKQLFY